MQARDPAAKRYADAVFGIAADSGGFDAWASDLDDIAALFADPNAAAYFISSRFTQADKESVVDRALPDAQAPARSLAKLLIRKRRTALAPQIGAAFRDRANAARGVASAAVTTAVPLGGDARAVVVEAVRGYTGADSVELDEQVDPAVIGGAVVRIGDRIIDGSVRARLASLRRSLAGSGT